MYREPASVCAVCGSFVEPGDADVIETGLRCRRCSDAAELAALAPALDEVREAQAWWRARAAAEEEARRERERGCSRHPVWDTYCFWCVLKRIGSDSDF